jgi:hypothetical protein
MPDKILVLKHRLSIGSFFEVPMPTLHDRTEEKSSGESSCANQDLSQLSVHAFKAGRVSLEGKWRRLTSESSREAIMRL